MYIPPHFKTEDNEQIAGFIRQNSFAILVSAHNDLPVATHLPLELDTSNSDAWILFGHMAKANRQWKNFTTDTEVLAIFLGAHSYISPSWYTKPNVPTWNYLAVHLYGKIDMIEGEQLEKLLKMQMERYEQLFAKTPQSYRQIPQETLQKDLNGVVGFQIHISKIEAARKLSQNRDTASKLNIIEALQEQTNDGAKEIAREMGNEGGIKK